MEIIVILFYPSCLLAKVFFLLIHLNSWQKFFFAVPHESTIRCILYRFSLKICDLHLILSNLKDVTLLKKLNVIISTVFFCYSSHLLTKVFYFLCIYSSPLPVKVFPFLYIYSSRLPVKVFFFYVFIHLASWEKFFFFYVFIHLASWQKFSLFYVFIHLASWQMFFFYLFIFAPGKSFFFAVAHKSTIRYILYRFSLMKNFKSHLEEKENI